MLGPGKVHGATLASGALPVGPDVAALLPHGIVRKVFGKQPGKKAAADDAVFAGSRFSGSTGDTGYEPMTYEQARLWLQCYNAGPYATLKYKGHVPYRETRNYVPRVMKYYAQKLDGSPYDKYIVASARKYGLDPQLIRAVMKAESDFNNKTVSHAGARGLMQVMPVVWSHVEKKYDLNWNYKSGVFEPEKNIEVACAYLAWLRYDFLPRHFADFVPTTRVPEAVVRDRGVPARKTSRIAVKAPDLPVATTYKKAVESVVEGSAISPEDRAARSALTLLSKVTLAAPENRKAAEQLTADLAKKAADLKKEAVQKLNLEELVAPAEPLKKSRRAFSGGGKNGSRQARSSS